MAYIKQTFVDNETILTANHLNNIESGIVDLENNVQGYNPITYNYTAKECINAFVDEMNKKASLIGAKQSLFKDPIGVENTSTAYDMCKIILNAAGYEKLYDYWNKPTHTLNLIQTNGTNRSLDITSTVVAGSKSPVLGDKYFVVGGKTGSLSGPKIYNLVCLCRSNENEDDYYAVAALGANEYDSGTSHRFQAVKEIMDAVETTYNINKDWETPEDPFNEIAWESLTYRDIFITNNIAPNINAGSISGYAISNGNPTIVSDETPDNGYAHPYSLKCFGSVSQQLKSSATYKDYPYFVASNVKVNRYTSGRCGIAFYSNFAACKNSTTNGWECVSAIISDRDGKGDTGSTNIFVGTASSANLDGYVNNPVVVPMSIFNTKPSAEELRTLYNNFTNKIISVGGSLKMTGDINYGINVCCSKACAIKMPKFNPRSLKYKDLTPVYTKDASTTIGPASTTKILTSMVLLDHVADLKAKVKITQAELDQIPSGFYGKDLLVNETITYDDLLYAMLLPSSNAACVIVARNVGELILRSKNL